MSLVNVSNRRLNRCVFVMCSKWSDARADLSLSWSHTSYSRFCRALAHMKIKTFYQRLTVVLMQSFLQEHFYHTIFFFFFLERTL